MNDKVLSPNSFGGYFWARSTYYKGQKPSELNLIKGFKFYEDDVKNLLLWRADLTAGYINLAEFAEQQQHNFGSSSPLLLSTA